MATEFQVLLWGDDPVFLRAVAEEALDEVERIERMLSAFLPASDISDLNARASDEAVRAHPEVYALLKRAARITAETEGAFDVTAGPLLRCWGFRDDRGHLPDEAEVADALARVGMGHVLFSDRDRTVRFDTRGVCLDLGAIGKGYAVEQAVEIVREHGVGGGMIHGGTSTIYAIGAPPDRQAWPIGIANPLASDERLGVARLRDRALSTSSGRGRFVEAGGRRHGHILDPRTGFPAEEAVSAVAIGPSPTETDALSTAFAVLGREAVQRYCERHPEVGAILVHREGEAGSPQVSTCGIAAEEAFEQCLMAVG